MSIIKRKSRIIEVNGESYRWLVSKSRKWWSGDLSIAIEKVDVGKKTLVVDPGFARPTMYTTDLFTDIVNILKITNQRINDDSVTTTDVDEKTNQI